MTTSVTSRPHRERFVDAKGYVRIWRPGHPRAHLNYVYEHLLVVEAVLGHLLPVEVEVHHVNENKQDNQHRNLVACQDRTYHVLLHRRQEALAACGHAGWLRCTYCKRWDDPSAVTVVRRRSRRQAGDAYHRSCAAAYQRDRDAAS